jgi:vitamin B12 transporter
MCPLFCSVKVKNSVSLINFILGAGMIILLHRSIVGTAAAEDTAGDIHVMPPVVVSATRSPLHEQDVAANITVISSAQIEQLPAASVAQVLKYTPGISIQFNGGPGSVGNAVRIQGSEIHHVAIYQDGVPLNQLVNPRTDLSYMPIDSVDRIEIYKGAASSAWGSALGGVVNIITKAPDADKPPAANGQASCGTHASVNSRASASGTRNQLGWRLSYTHEQSDGFIPHTEYNLDGVHAQVDLKLKDTNRLNLALAHNQGQNADPILNWADFSSDPFWDDIERQLSYQRLLLESKLTADMMLTLAAHHRQSDSTVEDVYPDRREQFLDYAEELWGGGARLSWRSTPTNTVVAGFEGNWGRFEWVPFVDPQRTDHMADWAVYANDTFSRGALSVNVGTRFDNSQDYDSAFSPALGATFSFTGLEALIRAQIAKGFTAPDYGWVNDPTFGNPHLKPEHTVNCQIGGEIAPIPWLNMELNFFRADVEELIRFDDTTMRYENIEEATRQGFEWAMAAGFESGLSIRIGGSHVDVQNDTTHDGIKDIPQTQYHASLLYAKASMSHSLLGNYIDNNSSYPETRDKVFLFDYLVKIKLKETKNCGQWSLYGAIYNLFNADYLVREVWPQPGRWGELGIRFNI